MLCRLVDCTNNATTAKIASLYGSVTVTGFRSAPFIYGSVMNTQ